MTNALAYLSKGGALLAVLFMLAWVVYAQLYALWRGILALRAFQWGRERWQGFAMDLGKAPEAVRAPLTYVLSARDPMTAIDEVRAVHLRPLERRLPLLFTLISAAPLLGLLGTVLGMLRAFEGLKQSAGESAALSGGIAEALLTTQAGLMIAIPAYLIAYHLRQNCRRLEDSFQQLEHAAHLVRAEVD